jgi:hypothetical protein
LVDDIASNSHHIEGASSSMQIDEELTEVAETLFKIEKEDTTFQVKLEPTLAPIPPNVLLEIEN